MASSKILAIKLRALGDTVILTASLKALHRAYPRSQIHVLVTAAYAPILEHFPGISKVWTYERPSSFIAKSRSLSRLAFFLRKEKFEKVLNFHAGSSSAALSLSTGAPIRSIHFHGHQSRNRHSTVIIPGKGTLKPIIERDLDTIRALGIDVGPGELPQIFLSSTEIANAHSFLNSLNLKNRILGMSLGSSRPTKSWPVERFVSLAVEWIQNSEDLGSVVLFGGPNESHIIHLFLQELNQYLCNTITDTAARARVRSQVVVLEPQPLRHFAALLSLLSVWVGNDSGPKHMAVAVGTPTVTLFGPEHPFEWHPYPLEQHPISFIENLECRKSGLPGMPPWCGISVCQIEEHKCMRLIGVAEVLEKCQKISQERR